MAQQQKHSTRIWSRHPQSIWSVLQLATYSIEQWNLYRELTGLLFEHKKFRMLYFNTCSHAHILCSLSYCNSSKSVGYTTHSQDLWLYKIFITRKTWKNFSTNGEEINEEKRIVVLQIDHLVNSDFSQLMNRNIYYIHSEGKVRGTHTFKSGLDQYSKPASVLTKV